MADDVLPSADSDFGRRVRTRLHDERLIWLTTTSADGTPQPNPVWFLWQDPDTVLVYCQPSAARLRHLAQRPRVALNLEGNGRGGDIVVLAGSAQTDPGIAAAHDLPAYLDKYRDAMSRVSDSLEGFGASYSVPVRITVDRVRGF